MTDGAGQDTHTDTQYQNQLLSLNGNLKKERFKMSKNPPNNIEITGERSLGPAPMRPICEIAREIGQVWGKIGKGVSPHALPYLDAMLSLNWIDEMYIADTAQSIVAYGLSNMSTFRGGDAQRLKAELKEHLDSAE